MEADREAFLAAAERLRLQLLENRGAGLLEDLVHAEREHEEAVQRWLWAPRTPARHQAVERCCASRWGPPGPRWRRRWRRSRGTAMRGWCRASSRSSSRTAGRWSHPHRVGAGAAGDDERWRGCSCARLRPLHREAQDSEQRFRLLVEGVQDYAHLPAGCAGAGGQLEPGRRAHQGLEGARRCWGAPSPLLHAGGGGGGGARAGAGARRAGRAAAHRGLAGAQGRHALLGANHLQHAAGRARHAAGLRQGAAGRHRAPARRAHPAPASRRPAASSTSCWSRS